MAIMSHRPTAVASRAIELSMRRSTFTVDDVRQGVSNPPSRSTIYRVLSQLETDDWIQRSGKKWKPDLKAKGLADRDLDDKNNTGFSIDSDDIL